MFILASGYSALILLLCIRSYYLNFHKGIRFHDESIQKTAFDLHKIAAIHQEVYIINAWDNLYMLSNTVPVTRPWYPHLAWYMEQPGVQEQIVDDLKSSRPLWIITTNNSEGLSAYTPEQIYQYIGAHYSEAYTVDNYKFLIRVR